MAEKIIGAARRVAGAKGSWQRRWAVLLSLVIAVGAAVVIKQTVLAVHNSSPFELDAPLPNFSVGADVISSAAPFDDWDKVCWEVAGDVRCGATSPTTSATAVSWTADCPVGAAAGPLDCGSLSATIFTGGGSKDPQPIGQWAWKDESGGLPDKDNLLHAFAARYSMPSSPDCPGPADNMDGTTSCEIIYFGSDRYANDGDAQQGFWFLQDEVALGTNKLGGGLGFTGEHRNGDLLVISDFSNGGTNSTITVYVWNTICLGDGKPMATCSAANLQRLTALDQNASCYVASDPDPYCGVVNEVDGVFVPWPFTNKDGENTYDTNELFEAGINLSSFNLGDRCFATVVAESRSSTSATSTLKDFVIGTFGECETTLTTTASLNALGDSIGPGSVSSGYDAAVVEVKGVSTWSGTLNFYLCGPFAAASSTECDDDGVLVTSRTVSNASPATDFDSQTATLTSAGRYCWYATFTPDAATAAAGVGGAEHAGNGQAGNANLECFIISPAVPAVLTTAGADVVLGNYVTDAATVSGLATEPGNNGATNGGNATYPSINANNGAYAGTITFVILGPGAANCTTSPSSYQGTTPTGLSQSLTGNGIYNASFAPNQPGEYHWKATIANATSINNVLPYTHNGDCSDDNEDVDVLQIATAISTAPWGYPNDAATITSANGGLLPANGTIAFKLFGADSGTGTTAADNCAANGATGLKYSQTFTNVVAGGGEKSVTKETSNSSFRVNSLNWGTFYWRVEYTPGSSTHTGRQSACFEELTINGTNDGGTGTLFP